jgi:hypothetical protein
MDRSGLKTERVIARPDWQNWKDPEWAPDGSALALTGGNRIVTIRPTGQLIQQVATGNIFCPAWQPDAGNLGRPVGGNPRRASWIGGGGYLPSEDVVVGL